MSFKYSSFSSKNDVLSKIVPYGKDHLTTKKEDYRIVISQDGKYAVTFDIGKVVNNNFVILYNFKYLY